MQLAVQILLEAAVKLECTIAVRTRALVLYHHFMRSSSNRSALEHNEIMVAAAALKCAARYEEENIDYDTIALVFFCIVNETIEVLHPKSQEYTAIKKSLITVDNIMQRKLEYTFSHRLAHQFLVPFLSFIFERNFKLAPFHKQVSLTCIRFANDAYTDPLCLNYKPDHIAIACIHASLHVHGLLKEMELLEPWFQAFSRDLTVTKLREIKVFLFRLYNGEKRIRGEGEQDEECEVVDEDGEKENEEVQEMYEEEGNQEQEVGKRKREEGQKKPETEGKKKCVGVSKRKQGELGKRKHERSKGEHEEDDKKRHEGDKDTLEEGDKNKLEGGDEGELEEESKQKPEESDQRKCEEEVKKKLDKDNEKEPDGDNEREERGENKHDKESEKDSKESSENETDEIDKKKLDIKSEKEAEESGRKELEENEKKPEGGSEEEQDLDASSQDDSSTIDRLLSAWTARFRAARSFNCSVTDI